MRIKRLKINSFKNLQSFEMNLDVGSFTTVLVGKNGTGKSNVLEALIIIFRDLDLGEGPAFAYELEYTHKGTHVAVDADPKRKKEHVTIKIDGHNISAKEFARKGGGAYLPNNVFGYYSGPSNRMEMHFAKHQDQFSKDLYEGVDKPLRPLLYARLVHSQFVLLSFFERESTGSEFLKKYLRIQDLESVLFILKRPYWSNAQRLGGDPRFWGAKGVVQEFLSRLYKLSLAPLKTKQKQAKGSTSERLYLFLKDKNDLLTLAEGYSGREEFFKALESMYISDLIQDVRTRVKIMGADEALTFRELSEGEQQLLMVLGLLRFTKEEETLFLLDEPDTHLNPAWSLEYLRLLKDTVEDTKTNQIIMATHDPLVVAGLTKSEVQVMRRDEKGRIIAEHPDEDPKGMGVSALLTSEMYGLRSELDPETMELLDRKRELAVKPTLTDDERLLLTELNRKLEGLDFTKTARDPMYKLFVEAMATVEKEHGLQVPVLTKEQQEEQRELALQIARNLTTERE